MVAHTDIVEGVAVAEEVVVAAADVEFVAEIVRGLGSENAFVVEAVGEAVAAALVAADAI